MKSKAFTKGWVPRARPGFPLRPMWMMSPGFLTLTRALEIAIINGDITPREASLIVYDIDWAFIHEDVQEQAAIAKRRETSGQPVRPKRNDEAEEDQQKAS